MCNKRADDETLLDVDVMVLDYLIYMAVEAMLQQSRARMEKRKVRRGQDLDLRIAMVDGKNSS